MYCENAKLLIDSSVIGELESFRDLVDSDLLTAVSIDGIIEKISCGDDPCECQDDECKECKVLCSDLEASINAILLSLEIETVDYIQWKGTDSEQKEKLSLDAESFAALFVDKFNQLKVHSWVNKHQSATLKQLRRDLPTNTFMICLDYS